MNHIHIPLQRNLDNLVAGQVRTDGRVLAALADEVGLVGLLPVHAQTVLIAEDGDGVQGQLVGGAEDADRDLAAVGDCNWMLVDQVSKCKGNIQGNTWIGNALDEVESLYREVNIVGQYLESSSSA